MYKYDKFLSDTKNTIRGISDGISKMINFSRPKPSMLPAILTYCTAMRRPGLSAISIASRVIARQEEEGLAFGPMPDGTQNGFETLVKIMTEEIVNAIKYESRVDASIPIGSIRVKGLVFTANGTGTFDGTNVNVAKCEGISV